MSDCTCTSGTVLLGCAVHGQDLQVVIDTVQHGMREELKKARDEAKVKEKATKAKRKSIKEKVKETFTDGIGTGSFGIDVLDHREGGFTVEFRDHEVTFDDLMKLSETFGTKKINFGTETRNDGFCDTCSYSYSVCVVRVDDISEEWR